MLGYLKQIKLFRSHPAVVSCPGCYDALDGVTLLEEQMLPLLRAGFKHCFGVVAAYLWAVFCTSESGVTPPVELVLVWVQTNFFF